MKKNILILFLICIHIHLFSYSDFFERLSQEEKKYIKEHKEITFGINQDDFPIFYHNNGERKKCVLDYFYSFFETKLEIKFVPMIYNSWDDAYNGFLDDEFDIVPAIVYTKERAKLIDFTIPYYISDNVIITKIGREKISDISSLPKGTKVVCNRNDFFYYYLKENYPHLDLIEVDNYIQCLNYVSQGKAEFTLKPDYVVNDTFSDMQLLNLTINNILYDKRSIFQMGTLKKNNILNSILNKLIESLTYQETRDIYNYFTESQKNKNITIVSELTNEEKQFLKENNIIKIGVDPDYFPIEAIDKTGKHIGVIPEILAILEKKLNVTFEVQKRDAWKDVLVSCKNGAFPVIAECSKTPQRHTWLNFTVALFELQTVLVTQKDTPFLLNISSLENVSIAYCSGTGFIEKIINNNPKINFVEYDTHNEVMSAVASEQVFGAIVSQVYAQSLFNNGRYNDLKINNTLQNYPNRIHMAVRKDYPLLYNILNKGLISIPLSQRNQLLSKITISDKVVRINKNLLVIIISIILLIISIFIVWLFLLNRFNRSLKYSNEKFTFLASVIQDGVFEFSLKEGRFSYLSPKVFKIFGFDKIQSDSYEKFLSLNSDFEIFFIEVQGNLLNFKKTSNETNDYFVFIGKFKNQVGEQISLEIKYSFDYNYRENEYKVIGKISDVTQIINEKTNLKLAVDNANKTAKAKSYFLANMSHEIRTPLNSIIGFSEVLNETFLNGNQKAYVSNIVVSGKALMNIINDVLDYSKIEAGEIHLEIIEINFDDFIQDTLKIVKYNAISKGINLLLDIKTKLPRTFYGDIIRLRQILINLLNNAIKFTDQGEVELIIDFIEKKNSRGEIHFSVRDTGIGIMPENQNKLFNKYTQAENSTSRKFGGTGLGLSISKNLVNIMGGDITLESEYGKGSIFSFNIITRVTDLNYSLKEIENVKNILIIDNCKKALENTANILKSLGIHSYSCNNYSDGYHLLQQYDDIDIIIMNSYSKNENVIDFVTQVRNSEYSFKKIPIITSDDITDPTLLKKLCSELRVNACIAKPISTLQIHKVLKNIFNSCVCETVVTKSDHHLLKINNTQKIKILVVDDVDLNVKLVKINIEKIVSNVKIEVAKNGKEAVEYCKKEKFDLIFMDIHMPEMDGIEATKVIRENHSNKNNETPIVALTAAVVMNEVHEYYQVGMNDVIHKPFYKKDIFVIIKKYCFSKYYKTKNLNRKKMP